MTLPVYPKLTSLAWPIKWTPNFFNMPSSIATDGSSIDLALASTPLHTFELTYEVLRDATGLLEFQTLMGFFLSMQGTVGRFAFSLPTYNYVQLQLIGVGDGTTATFQIPLVFGTSNGFGSEPVGVLDLTDITRPLHVYVNGGILAGGDYSINTTVPCNQTVTFTGGAPAMGAVLTMDFGYYYYCRFADNNNEFENFMYQRSLITKIVLQSCRQGA
jgi:hypothetical protein